MYFGDSGWARTAGASTVEIVASIISLRRQQARIHREAYTILDAQLDNDAGWPVDGCYWTLPHHLLVDAWNRSSAEPRP